MKKENSFISIGMMICSVFNKSHSKLNRSKTNNITSQYRQIYCRRHVKVMLLKTDGTNSFLRQESS